MKVRVLAARPGLRVPFCDATGHPVRGAQGAISITEAGLLFEHSGEVRPGPVLVDDSTFIREQVACGDLRFVPDDPPPARTARRGRDEE